MIRVKNTVEGTALRHKLGLSVPVIILLAALAALRVVPHDLGIVSEGSVAAWLLVFVPLAIWLIVVLRRRVPNPFLTLVVIGVAYGVMLAVGHQLLWAAWDGRSPRLGGNLEGVLGPGLQAAAFRTATFLSSIVTGTIVGAVVGFVASAIEHARRT